MSAPLTLLDLFSGIGGFSLGLERTGGFRTIAFCECEPYPRAVLANHWPEVPCYDDIRTLTAERMAADGLVRPDAICGGFPCQDISAAGKGAGIEGERSGLWREMRRLVSECRPRWVVAENVSALRTRGADRVLGDLETLGYACWPLVVGAAHAGAPHRRGRAWILAYADDGGREGREAVCRRQPFPFYSRSVSANSVCEQHEVRPPSEQWAPGQELSADVDGKHRRIEQRQLCGIASRSWNEPDRCGPAAADSRLSGLALPKLSGGHCQAPGSGHDGRSTAERGWWSSEPDVVRVAYGVPARVDRIAALGNAVVPQVVEAIGRAILAVERGAS